MSGRETEEEFLAELTEPQRFFKEFLRGKFFKICQWFLKDEWEKCYD